MNERHIRLLTKQNPWWAGKEEKLPEFKRDIFSNLLKYIKYKQIIAIVGLRRVGKTVLVKQIIQRINVLKNNMCYVSFDDIDFQKYETAEELINYFLEFSNKNKKRYLFLDEIQKLPNWADLLKTYYDTENNLKVFISGSASLEIKEHKETLAGRILTFYLPTLTFSEFVRYHKTVYKLPATNLLRTYDLNFAPKKEKYKLLFSNYLEKGAFPELLAINDEEFIKKYIRESVIEKTVSDITKLAKGDEKVIYELVRLLASTNAQLFETSNIANALKINRFTASSYINLLEKTFLLKVAYNFTTSVSKQVRASKKQYCAHSAIVIALLDYPFAIINTDIAGHLVEATIANSFNKVSFWRTPQRDEVDLVLKEREIIPIEIKYQQQITNNDLKPLLKFCDRFKVRKGIIVTKDLMEKRNIKGNTILFIPAWFFLLADISKHTL